MKYHVIIYVLCFDKQVSNLAEREVKDDRLKEIDDARVLCLGLDRVSWGPAVPL
jgi:hypothetical protein